MKLNTMEKMHDALLHGRPEIVLDEDVRLGALRSLRRMLELG
jgi:quinolinate synthase